MVVVSFFYATDRAVQTRTNVQTHTTTRKVERFRLSTRTSRQRFKREMITKPNEEEEEGYHRPSGWSLLLACMGERWSGATNELGTLDRFRIVFGRRADQGNPETMDGSIDSLVGGNRVGWLVDSSAPHHL